MNMSNVGQDAVCQEIRAPEGTLLRRRFWAHLRGGDRRRRHRVVVPADFHNKLVAL